MGIRIAFSGGGFRATLFHLGVVRFLWEKKDLEKVEAICSVSGGSILAAHLVLNWDKYTGTASQFSEAASELINLTQTDVRNRILRRWFFVWSLVVFLWLAPLSLVPYFLWDVDRGWAVILMICWHVLAILLVRFLRYRWSLISELEREYNACYSVEKPAAPAKQGTLTGNAAETSRPATNGQAMRSQLALLSDLRTTPELYVLATNLTTGQLCAFEKDGLSIFKWNEKTQSYEDNPVHELNSLSVARAVAASSAFPVLFSPVKISNADAGGKKVFSHPQMLADGGIFENYGLEGFIAKFGKTMPEDCTLVLSDGQAVFDPEYLAAFNFLKSRATRTIDILMHRVSSWQISQAIGTKAEDESSTKKTIDGGQPAPQTATTAAAAAANPPNAKHPPMETTLHQQTTNRAGTAAVVRLVNEAKARNKFLHVSLSPPEPVKDKLALYPKIQNLVAGTRTDLDSFTNVEIHLLVYQGFCAARASFEVLGGEVGAEPCVPANAYQDGWNPASALTEKEQEQLRTNADRVFHKSVLRHAWAVAWREGMSPLNYLTILFVAAIFFTLYPVFANAIHWWQSSPVTLHSWGVKFVESPQGPNAVELQKEKRTLAGIWSEFGTSCKSCKQVLLATVPCGTETGRAMRKTNIALTCETEGHEWAGALFLVTPNGREPSRWAILEYASSQDFRAERVVSVPESPADAYLVAVVVIKGNDFQDDLKKNLKLEVRK